MELVDLEKLIRSRRSIRAWQDKAVPEELLLKAVELATWAPNGGNQQNWHFYIITSRDTIQTIAEAVQASADQIASWPEADRLGVATGLRQRASFFRTAPAAIVVASSQYQSAIDQLLANQEKTDRRARQIRKWRNLADSRIQSSSAAVAYLLLVLHQMGLGTVWMTGPTHAKGEIEKILRVPRELDFVTLIPVGYPAESPVSGGRRPVGEVSEVIR